MRMRALLHIGTSLAGGIVLTILYGCATGTSATIDDTSMRVATMQNDVRNTAARLANLEERVDNVQSRMTTLEQDQAALQQTWRNEQAALRNALETSVRSQQSDIERNLSGSLSGTAQQVEDLRRQVNAVLRTMQEENAKLQQKFAEDMSGLRAAIKTLQDNINESNGKVDRLERDLQNVVAATAAAVGSGRDTRPTPATPTPATPVTRTSTPSHPDIDYSRGYEHTVQAGETLWKIARDYNVTIQDIVNVNPSINNSSALSLGQKIFVPFRKQKDTQPQP